MASKDKGNDLSLQIELEEISLRLKVWRNLYSAAIPRLKHDLEEEDLLEQCNIIGKIFQKMPKYQVRLLALQLSGSLPEFTSKENDYYLNDLARISMEWRELYVHLNRWHAQLQTTFLKSDGFRKHCKTLEADLQKFGDKLFHIQQSSICSVYPTRTTAQIKDLRTKLAMFRAKAQCYRLCLVAMKYGIITMLRQSQLEESEQCLREIESLLELQTERFELVARRSCGIRRGANSQNSLEEKKSTDREAKTPVKPQDQNLGSDVSDSDAAMLWEQSYKHDLSQIIEVSESSSGKKMLMESSNPSVVIKKRSPTCKRRLMGILLGTLSLDILFLGSLLLLLAFLCPTWDRFSLCGSFDNLATSWIKRWPGFPPS